MPSRGRRTSPRRQPKPGAVLSLRTTVPFNEADEAAMDDVMSITIPQSEAFQADSQLQDLLGRTQAVTTQVEAADQARDFSTAAALREELTQLVRAVKERVLSLQLEEERRACRDAGHTMTRWHCSRPSLKAHTTHRPFDSASGCLLHVLPLPPGRAVPRLCG